MNDLECKDNCCPLRYDMTSSEMNFDKYTVEEKFDIISDFKSEAPAPIPTMSEEEWAQWAEQNWPSVPKKEDTPPFNSY